MENNNEVKEEVKVEVKTPKKKKTWLIILSIIIVLAIIGVTTFFLINGNKSTTKNEEKLKPLPLPEVTGGERGKLGIDKNINESVIDEYLNRSDSVYRDMRMFEDPAKYEPEDVHEELVKIKEGLTEEEQATVDKLLFACIQTLGIYSEEAKQERKLKKERMKNNE